MGLLSIRIVTDHKRTCQPWQHHGHNHGGQNYAVSDVIWENTAYGGAKIVFLD